MKHLLIIAGLALVVLALILVQVPCKPCRGTGAVTAQSREREPCPYCHGRGTIEPKLAPAPDVKSTFSHGKATCPACKGEGYREDSGLKKTPCPRCEGRGRIPLYRWLLDRSGL